MSFDWNLSDEDEDLDAWTQRTGYATTTAATSDQNHDPNNNNNNPHADIDADTSFHVSYEHPVTPSPFAAAPGSFLAKRQRDDDNASDDGDSVDWEDVAPDNDDNDLDTKPAAVGPTRAIHIDLNDTRTEAQRQSSSNDDGRKQQQAKRRHKFRLESLPQSMQRLLIDLHRSHLLALTSRAVFVSRICSDMETMALAHSLLPSSWSMWSDTTITTITTTATETSSSSSIPPPYRPSLRDAQQFLNWYHTLVHNVEDRRARQHRANLAAGAPAPQQAHQRQWRHRRRTASSQPRASTNAQSATLSSSSTTSPWEVSLAPSSTARLARYAHFLSSTHDEDPQLLLDEHHDTTVFSSNDRVQLELFIAMTRSMGWRTRLVLAGDPVPIDLTVDHPLLLDTMEHAKNHTTIFAAPSRKRKKSHGTKATAVRSENDHGDDSMGSPLLDAAATSNTTTNNTNVMEWAELLCADPNAKSGHRWCHVDPRNHQFHRPDQIEVFLGNGNASTPNHNIRSSQRGILAYAIGVEHCPIYRTDCMNHSRSDNADTNNHDATSTETRLRLTDVTPRYASSWIDTLRQRGIVRSKKCSFADKVRTSWWTRTLQTLNKEASTPLYNDRQQGSSPADAIELDVDHRTDGTDPTTKAMDEVAQQEEEELETTAANERIPTSKASFTTHPVYVIPSVLGKAEVLAPDASQRVCGVFKGQLVYRRADVSTVRTAKKWLYEGRKVCPNELARPIKQLKRRKKPDKKGFQALRSYGVGSSNDGSHQRRAEEIAKASIALDNGMDDVYAHWQTSEWSPPPIGPNDTLPVNDYRNIELALLNPGLVHIDQRGIAPVAKKLGIPYAPCLLGFEGHGGNRTATIRGIIVHEHNADIVREAGQEVRSHEINQESEQRRRDILLRWKKLMVGLLTKDRLERDYAQDDE